MQELHGIATGGSGHASPEIDHHDAWQSAVIACAMISNSTSHTQRVLQSVINWVENYWPDVTVIDDQIEII